MVFHSEKNKRITYLLTFYKLNHLVCCCWRPRCKASIVEQSTGQVVCGPLCWSGEGGRSCSSLHRQFISWYTLILLVDCHLLCSRFHGFCPPILCQSLVFL